MTEEKKLYNELSNIVEKIYEVKHKVPDFIPGISRVPVNGRVFSSDEIKILVKASVDFWLTDGEYSEEFSQLMSKFIGLKHIRLVNSGSSANLVAVSSLTSSKIKNNLQEGDHVITSAVGFPTTVNPIFQNNLVPIFVDCEIGTYNPTADDLINAYTENTKLIFLAHTLGNPLEMDKLVDLQMKKTYG
jgi:CDP-6-deoxy-D-xylo-4-hexulose-3-dehydrase